MENLYYETPELVNKVLDNFISKGIIKSADEVWRVRRPGPDTTWADLITAFIVFDDIESVSEALGYTTVKGFTEAQRKTGLNKRVGKPGYAMWRTWLCNTILGVHYCKSCECYHEVKYFDTVKRGGKVQREVEYKHMCFETYNRDYQREHNRIYKNKNPHKIKEASARRRARKQNCAISEDRDALDAFYENCPEGYEVDHILPLSLGGKHCLSNLQYLTAKENRFKSSLDPESWVERKEKLIEAGRLD